MYESQNVRKLKCTKVKMYESEAIDLYVIMGVLFLLLST
jgi:hypothetical protein